MKRLYTLICILLSFLPASCTRRDGSNDINIRVERVWNTDRYCAFTSIAKYKGRYFIAFRDDDGHIWGPDGKAEGCIRVLVSDDGSRWETTAFFHVEGQDLRDPDLSLTPDGRLMLLFGQSTYVGHDCIARHPYAAFCQDGKNFSERVKLELDMDGLTGQDWLWKVGWAGDTGYGVVYSILPEKIDGKTVTKVTLVSTRDALHYQKVTELDVPYDTYPNETAVHQLSDGRLAMLMRRESKGGMALWGVSEAPYTDWKFKDFGMRVGGPQFIELEDGTIVAGTRTYFLPDSHSTMLLTGKADGGFREHCILPSGGNAGDMSYVGFLIEGDELWVSYYSAHENPHPSIYLAKMPLSQFRQKDVTKD